MATPNYTNTPQGTYIGGKFYANNGGSDSAFPSTPTPIGTKAKSPITTPTTNTLPTGQTAPTTLPNLAKSGPYTPPNQGTTGVNQGGLIGNLVNQSQNANPLYSGANDAYQKAIGDYNQSVQNEAKGMAGIKGEAIPLQFQQGREQVLQGQYAAQQAGLGGLVSGASNALSAANTAAGQQLSAGTSAAQINQPQFGVSPGTGVGQPSTGNVDYGSSPYGSGVQASSNINSVKDAQSIINNITQYSPQISTNLNRAVDLANTAHLDPNSPLLTGLQHAVSSGLITSQALTAFNSAIESLNNSLQQVGEAPIDPSTITPSALKQLMQTIPNNLKIKTQGAQDLISGITSGNTSGGTNSSGSNGSNATFYQGSDGKWHYK